MLLPLSWHLPITGCGVIHNYGKTIKMTQVSEIFVGSLIFGLLEFWKWLRASSVTTLYETTSVLVQSLREANLLDPTLVTRHTTLQYRFRFLFVELEKHDEETMAQNSGSALSWFDLVTTLSSYYKRQKIKTRQSLQRSGVFRAWLLWKVRVAQLCYACSCKRMMRHKDTSFFYRCALVSAADFQTSVRESQQSGRD